MTIAFTLPTVEPTKATHCEFCGKKLSIYNENRFCFVHIYKGYQSDQQIEEERRQRNARLLQKSRERALR